MDHLLNLVHPALAIYYTSRTDRTFKISLLPFTSLMMMVTMRVGRYQSGHLSRIDAETVPN